jgi:hypothetical protein
MPAIMESAAGAMQMANGESATGPRVLSVGHSNHDLPTFLRLLRANGVTALADVRSSPYSRRHPHFSRDVLERALRESGIEYLFLGDQLGGRPQPRELYDDEGRVDYEKVRTMAFFREGLERLLKAAERSRIAMMCGEQDPLDCHRGLMITPALIERGVAPGHIRKDGSGETTAEMERRLLDATGKEGGMFDGLFAAVVSEEERRQVLAEAYRDMAKKKAFRLRQGIEEAGEDSYRDEE